MAIPTLTTHSANELAAANRPSTAICGQNWLRSLTSARWTRDASAATNLTLSSTSYSDPLYPISNLCDGSLSTPSRPLSETSGIRQYALIMDFGAAVDIDTVMIKPLDMSLYALSLDLYLSTSSTFGAGDTVDVCGSTWHGLGSTRKRLINCHLGNATDGYGVWSARYAKLTITSASDIAATPSISEIVIGRRRQFTFGASLPHDPRALESSFDDFDASGGQRRRYAHFVGRGRRECSFQLADFSYAGGLDDRAQSSLVWSDCGLGRYPVLYLDDVFGADNETRRLASVFGFFDGGSFSRPYQGPLDQSWEFEIIEQPEFVSMEE